ncbi:MAG: YitT family protein [Eubacterium sp.]|nr:YitT family protein [Eubacterium sp.]
MAVFASEHNQEKAKLHLKDAALIFIGTTIMALGVQYILDPASLVTGGFSGLSIIIKHLTAGLVPGGVPLWVSNVVLNIPLFLFSARIEGFRSILRTAFSWAIMSVELAILPRCSYVIHQDQLLLVALYGGVCFGTGCGLVLMARATSGGTDMLARTLHLAVFPQISMGRLMQVIDGIIVVIGFFVFGVEHTAYAVIAVFVMGRVIDVLLDHGKRAKIALIISDQSDAIANDVLFEMNRGITSIRGTGRYSGKTRDILVVVCANRDLPELKEIVHKHDRKPFFIVATVSEAFGEGFIQNWSK